MRKPPQVLRGGYNLDVLNQVVLLLINGARAEENGSPGILAASVG